MTDTHNKSFFGNTVGMILDSPSKTEQNIFLTFLRKLPEGAWEKPSNKEGKKITLNLEEMVWLLEVLYHRQEKWSTVHTFGESSTKISIAWIKDQKGAEKFCIQVNGYKKYLNLAESIILTKLLEHLLEEKIAFATIPYQRERENGNNQKQFSSQASILKDEREDESLPSVVEEIIPPKRGSSSLGKPIKPSKTKDTTSTTVQEVQKETNRVAGVIQGKTDKAVRILFENGKELWIPKSTIKSDFNSDSENLQTFTIDTWILKKNELLS